MTITLNKVNENSIDITKLARNNFAVTDTMYGLNSEGHATVQCAYACAKALNADETRVWCPIKIHVYVSDEELAANAC